MKREKKCTGTMPTMRVDKRLGMGAQFVPCKTTETSTRKPRRTITQTVHVHVECYGWSAIEQLIVNSLPCCTHKLARTTSTNNNAAI
ncbi:hypothetical protein ACN38_g1651 [Penicillium nordicum]|uniref:Uncharacterized protein n=1 Tax=Penicillium nordicum TaxID=229535 RepID=A0A0M8PF45_9EURO|nr:hypothetical protein ACN38_g1651 [Penicillium nordicum]